jgi:inositol transport system substrate-binding protein
MWRGHSCLPRRFVPAFRHPQPRDLVKSGCVLILTFLVLLLSACSRTSDNSKAVAREPVIGVSMMNLSNEFIVMLNRAMEAKAKELGVRLIVNDAQHSAEKQVQQVETFAAERVDAIILNPCEVEASSPAVDRAVADGIPIVNVNSETRSPPSAFVGSRDEESARIAMEYIAKRLGGKGNIVMMHGFMGQAAQIKRDQGAREVLKKYPGLRLIADQTAEWDRAKAMTLMENWLQSYGDKINAVFAQNDEMAMGALMAIEQSNQKGKIVTVGVDSIADALEAVKAGRLDATVFQDAQGQAAAAVETALKLIRKQPVEKQVYIPFQLVTKENVAQFLK